MEKIDGYIVLFDMGSSYQPVLFADDFRLRFFDTYAAASEAIEERLKDSTLSDYTISPATKEGEIIECMIDDILYAMYESDEDFMEADKFYDKLRPKTYICIQVVNAIDEWDAKIKTENEMFDKTHQLAGNIYELTNEFKKLLKI